MDTFFAVRFRRSGLHLRSSGVPETFVISWRRILFRWFVCAAVVLFIQACRKPSVNGTTVSDVFFSCRWRESVKPLQYFCHTLPIPYLLHQRKLLFWKKLYCSDSAVLQSLSSHMHQAFVAVGSLYNVLSPKLSNNSEN